MTTEKTAIAWFQKLKEPYRSQAIKASEEQSDCPYKKKVYKSLLHALVCEFEWEKTSLTKSWINIIKSIRGFETTYLAEPPQQ